MLKNRIIALILCLALSAPVFAVEELPNEPAEQPKAEEVAQVEQASATETPQDIKDHTADVEQAAPSTPYKQPTSKRKIAKKFLIAMFGVGISSVLIFGLLSIYNKVRSSFSKNEQLMASTNETSLETPEDLNGAIKTFLDKTKWN